MPTLHMNQLQNHSRFQHDKSGELRAISWNMMPSVGLRLFHKTERAKWHQKWWKWALLCFDLFMLIFQSLLDFLDRKSNAYIYEMVYFIWDEYDIMISESVIKCSLQKAHWSRKVVCFLILNKNHCIDDLTNCSLKNVQQRDVKSLEMHD